MIRAASATLDRCAYCEGPLPPHSYRGAASGGRPEAVYCCYGCRVLGERGARPVPAVATPSHSWFRLGVGAAISGQAMLLGLAVNVSPPEGPARWLSHGALGVSVLAVAGLLARPMFEVAWSTLRARQLGIELLFLAGIAGALATSLHATFTGVGSVYYEVVAVLLTVYAVGKTLGAQSRAQALAEASRLREAFDTCQIQRAEGSLASVRADEVQPGERVVIKAGEPIPVDGQVVQGEAFVRETPLTGEPFPVVRRPGDAVLAGSFSEDGTLVVSATAAGGNRRLDRVLAAAEEARSQPSSLQVEAQRWVQGFLPLVLAVALATFLIWGFLDNWTGGLLNALAVLLVSCPCAMGLATPLGIWKALATLATRGLVAHHAEFIPQLARVNHVVFDKTGTLSDDSFSLIDVACLGSPDERATLKSVLRMVQTHSPHPVARAFQNLPSDYPAPASVRSTKIVPGRGLEAWVRLDGETEWHVRIGQREFMHDLAAEPELLSDLRRGPSDHLVYVEVDGTLRAIGAVRERVRASARQTLEELGRLGLGVSVFTGDRAERAAALGLTEVRSGLTPEAKTNLLRALERSGKRVLYVGDGINDAPALRHATTSVALSHGPGLATSTAGAVLFGGDLAVLPWAVRVGRATRAVIRSNLWFAAAYNTLGMLLAALGWLHPVAAALLMVVSSLLVSWRALQATEQAIWCCEPAREETSPPTGRGSSSRNWWYAALLGLQGPCIGWAAGLDGLTTGVVSVFLLALAFGLACWRPVSAEAARYGSMTLAMLGPGNLGMILGWWIDAGFQPLLTAFGGGCCHANVDPLRHVLAMPWMYVGMLLFGLPPMLRDLPATASKWAHAGYALLASLGMVLGMSYGTALAHTLSGGRGTIGFLAVLTGMSLGMLAGMFFCCELSRALWTRWRPRRRPGLVAKGADRAG